MQVNDLVGLVDLDNLNSGNARNWPLFEAHPNPVILVGGNQLRPDGSDQGGVGQSQARKNTGTGSDALFPRNPVCPPSHDVMPSRTPLWFLRGLKRLQGFAQIIISLPPSEEQLTRIGSGNDEVVVGVVIQALVNRRLDLSHIGAGGIDLNEIPKSVASGHRRPGAEMRLGCSDLLKADIPVRRCRCNGLIHYNIGISTSQRRGSHRVSSIVSRAPGDGEGNPVDELQGMIPVDLEGLCYNDCAENRIVQLVVPMRVIPIGKLPRVATVCATACQ